MPEKIRFTVRNLRDLACPPGRARSVVFDADQAGLAVRVTRSGAKTFYVVTRVGSGPTSRVR